MYACMYLCLWQYFRYYQDDDREAEGDIREDRRTLNLALKEIEFTHEEYIRGTVCMYVGMYGDDILN